MRFFALGLLLLCLVVSAYCVESEDDAKAPPDLEDENWWGRFKKRVKTVLSRWRDDIKLLWDDVLAKADDMRGWTADMFNSFKEKMKEWLETRKELPDDEKNEIETFIQKLKVPTDEPEGPVTKVPKNIDP